MAELVQRVNPLFLREEELRQGMELLLSKMGKTKSNADFLAAMQK